MINHLTSVKTVTEGLAQATEQLAVSQSRLATDAGKSAVHSGCACRTGERRVVLIRQQAAEQNKAYQSTAGHERSAYGINRLLGLG